MQTTIKELKENLEEKIFDLGINPKMIKNPAYVDVLKEIKELFFNIFLDSDNDELKVQIENNKLLFEHTYPNQKRYFITITCISPNVINCTYAAEQKPYQGFDKLEIKQKTYVEKKIDFLKDESITISTNGADIDNFDCQKNDSNISSWSKKECYNKYGIMDERYYKEYKTPNIQIPYDKININLALNDPREAFTINNWENDSFTTRTQLIREKIDVARLIKEDKEKGILYSANVILNKDISLRYMSVLSSKLEDEVTISPLAKEEIDKMIEQEDNKVQEGLRIYAVDRDKYSYDSKEDKDFIYKKEVKNNTRKRK